MIIKTDTVITISLKEYAEMKARLDALEQAAQEAAKQLAPFTPAHDILKKALDGDK